MVASFLYITALVGLLAITSASPHGSTIAPRADIIPPSQDSFYVPPAGYEQTAPGAILRSRQTLHLGIHPWNSDIKLNASYQILYRTNDAHGNPDATVLSVLVPHGANMSRAMSIQDLEDSAAPDCATSYALLKGSDSATKYSKINFLGHASMLSKKWILAYPDYEGSKGAFNSGRTNGQATLDGIRALLSSQNITGIAPRDHVDVQMWGYSGGSIPTEWAAELQPSYAPELKIKSAILGGVVSNITATMLSINGNQGAGYIPSGILGMWKDYPEVTDYLNSQLRPETREAFMKPLSNCAWHVRELYNDQDISRYFRTSLLDVITNPKIRSIMAEGGQMGLHGLPEIPIYFYNTVKDPVAPIAVNDELVAKYCKMGIKSLVHKRFAFGNHLETYFTGYSGAVRYAMDRFDGIPAPDGCHIENISIRWPHLADLKEFALQFGWLMKELLG